MNVYEYKCKLVHIVDGDTVDVDIDLGFGVTLTNERVRLIGIDTPESRTSDKVEKVFGLAAKYRVTELLENNEFTLISSEFKGKFGRILGDFNLNGELLSTILLREHQAVPYFGKNKALIKELHLKNRKLLIESGTVSITAVHSAKFQ